MWNRLATVWQHDDSRQASRWDADRAPGLRLVLLWVGMIAPLFVVAVRMVQLQVTLRDDFATGFEQTYEAREEIPARDGRILAADGSVLAGETERHELQVHFRLVQEPVDASWIRREALKQLSRLERRDKPRVVAEETRVQQQREELWSRLRLLTELSVEQVAAARQAVQQRVVQTKQAVIKQREQREAAYGNGDSLTSLGSGAGWQRAWDRVRSELTQPPSRPVHSGPIAEEEGFHTIASPVTADTKSEIEAHPDRYPGVRVITLRRRAYPQGELAAHVIGTRTPLSPQEASARREQQLSGNDRLDEQFEGQHSEQRDDRAGDRVGRSGLELQYDSHLHGQRGERRLVKNRRGEVIHSEVLREPQHGRDLVLTLDADVQRRAEQLLDEALANVTLAGTTDNESHQDTAREATCPKGGCLVAIDVHTGAILAAAAAPRFDLNLLVASDANGWRDVLADPRKPLFSRATQMALAPGSVFKIITAVAALESGKLNADAPLYCQGYLDRPDQHRCLTYRHFQTGHGEMRLADALCRSCNVYFFTAARRMGPQTLADWADRFGIGQATGVDLPSESHGRLPSPHETEAGQRRRWHPGDTLGLAIGQSELLVTPIQMARAMAAVANDGQLVTPHFASASGPATLNEGPSFRPVFAHPEARPIEGLHSSTLDRVREGLVMVVHDSHGTGFKTVKLKDVTIAGKTGTAETNGADHAWFAGYVPAERPRVAFVVVLEHGGSGGKAAGPVARQFVSSLLELGLVTPSASLARE